MYNVYYNQQIEEQMADMAEEVVDLEIEEEMEIIIITAQVIIMMDQEGIEVDMEDMVEDMVGIITMVTISTISTEDIEDMNHMMENIKIIIVKITITTEIIRIKITNNIMSRVIIMIIEIIEKDTRLDGVHTTQTIVEMDQMESPILITIIGQEDKPILLVWIIVIVLLIIN